MKIGERGQITIPLKLRKRFGLNPFSEVEVLEENHQIVIRKKAKPCPIRAFAGVLAGKGKRTDRIMDDLRGR